MRLIALVLVLLACVTTIGVQAATPAGTIIRNQAVASYTGTDGRRVSVTSNLVETTVQQVAGIELTNDQQLRVSPGTRIGFSHRLRNLGNESDQFTLNASSIAGSISLNSPAVYADANADGVADNATPITVTPLLSPDDEYFVVIEALVPTTAIDGDTAQLSIVANSVFDALISDQNIDQVTVGTGPTIVVRKFFDQNRSLSPGGPITITLAYENEGDEAAGDVTLIDALPEGMSYVAGSARWSNTVAPLTDNDPDDMQMGTNSSIRYCAYNPSCTSLPEANLDGDASSVNQISAIIDLVEPGGIGTVTFEVNIDADLNAGFLQNTAEFEYDIAISSVGRQFSNTASFEVLASAGVVANGSTTSSLNGLSEPVNVVSAAQGGLVQFDNIIWNTGNAVDTFNIVVDGTGSTFPAGTIWQLLRDGGSGALTDTNNDGIVDTGPILPGTFARIVLQLTLPAGSAGNNAGLGFDVSKSARSITDATVQDSVTDHLDEIIGNSVDLTNQAAAGSAGALGVGPGPEVSPVSTVLANSSNLALFDLYIRHQGSAPDSYQLHASASATGVGLPAGWQVVFIDPVTNAAIDSTGVLNSGESMHVRAQVQLPANEPAATYSVWFSALSTSTGASDSKHDAFIVAPTASVTLEPSLSAQLEPGGTVRYKHVLINNGNITLGDIVLSLQDSRPDWLSAVYLDTNGDGLFDAGDQPYTTPLTLVAGETLDIFVEVFAPASAVTLQRNTTTVTASWNAASESVQLQDLSTVNQSRVVIFKEQAVDTQCDGFPDVVDGFGPGQIEVAPGNNCVVYRLTATNQGREPSYNVKIHDYTPPYTLYRTGAVCSRSPCWLVEPADGEVGIINAETDQLLPGDSFYLQFVVQIE